MADTWGTSRIREAFIYDGGESEYHDPIHGAQTQRWVAGDIFDTWLAAHDAEVASAARSEAINRVMALGYFIDTDVTSVPSMISVDRGQVVEAIAEPDTKQTDSTNGPAA